MLKIITTDQGVYESLKRDYLEPKPLEIAGKSFQPVECTLNWTGPGHCDFVLGYKPIEPGTAAPWNGEGLPPVGLEVEHSEEGNKADHPDGAWKRVKIVGHHRFNEDEYICAVWVSGLEVSYSSEGPHFRPICTAEQIAAEERAEQTQEMCRLIRRARDAGRPWADYLYDAGARLPGRGPKA